MLADSESRLVCLASAYINDGFQLNEEVSSKFSWGRIICAQLSVNRETWIWKLLAACPQTLLYKYFINRASVLEKYFQIPKMENESNTGSINHPPDYFVILRLHLNNLKQIINRVSYFTIHLFTFSSLRISILEIHKFNIIQTKNCHKCWNCFLNLEEVGKDDNKRPAS